MIVDGIKLILSIALFSSMALTLLVTIVSYFRYKKAVSNAPPEKKLVVPVIVIEEKIPTKKRLRFKVQDSYLK